MANIDNSSRSEATRDSIGDLKPCLQNDFKIGKHLFDVKFNGTYLTWAKNEPTKNSGESNNTFVLSIFITILFNKCV